MKTPEMTGEETGPNSAASLTRGLEILRAFGPGDSTLGNLDLIERTGLPKATVSRLTYALVRLGYLRYDENLGRYSIGAATVSLGYSALRSMPIVHIAQPILQDLADETGVAAAIGTRDGLEMIYLANCRSMGPVTLQLNVGSHLPIWRTAMGLAYMAAMNLSKRQEILGSLVASDPENETQIRKNVEGAVSSFVKDGFVGTYGTWYSYINAIGIAFRPEDGSPLVGLTCGGIVDVLPKNRCETIVKEALFRAVHRMKTILETGSDPGRS
jgi:DNA-binding IclR family transcriptional regulator